MSDLQFDPKNLDLENPQQLVTFCRQALAVLVRDENPEIWAACQALLAESLYRDPSRERDENLEESIACYTRALEVYTCNTHPTPWAAAHGKLGDVYWARIRGQQAANLERAIEHYERALEVYTREAVPTDWARIHNNLGNAYGTRILGERAENLERSIEHFKLALEVYTRKTFSELWAGAQNNLGKVYGERIRGERAENLERVIEHCGWALEVYTRDAFPEKWARNQLNLGAAYGARIRGDRAENLEQAIAHFSFALEVFSQATFPEEWAHAQLNLGNAYVNRIRGERAENLERAIEHFERAPEIYPREAFPERWARAQNNLSAAYSQRIRGEPAVNLERAIEHCESALNVFTRGAFPQDWASAQHNLGTIYSKRIRGERAANLEQAIEHFEQALNVFTHVAFPQDWALVQNNLGYAYSRRIRGERAENLERAIVHYDRALEVRMREAFPEKWAGAQLNLGTAYSERVRGERAENLERAIESYSRALEVYSREAFPEKWAEVQNNIGVGYSDRIRGERAENLERAIGHYHRALEVHTRETFPEKWAGARANLGNAYSKRIRGDRAENLERAIEDFDRALEVHTRNAFPELWARALDNLGTTYGDRIIGERAENLRRAIEHYERALEVFTRETFPAEHRRTQRKLGDLHFSHEKWAGAHAAYAAAVAAGADLLKQAYTEPGLRAEVGETARLFARHAYALLHLQRTSDALLALEQGKTRLLNEALALGELDLMTLPEAARTAMGAARQAVREFEVELHLPPGAPGRRDERELNELLRQAKAELDRQIDAVRVMRPDFMPTGLDLPELLGLAPADGALVAPFFTAKGSAAFVLPHGATAVTEDDVVLLDRFTDDDLLALLQGPGKAAELGGWLGAYARQATNAQAWRTEIERTGRTLWDVLFCRVHARLQALGLAEGASVVLLPQGGLGLLPLHTAWRRQASGERRYFLDDYTMAYAPSGYALATSRNRLGEPRRQQQSLLAVVDATKSLTFAPAEVEALAALFAEPKPRVLPPEQASREAVLGMAATCNYLHFACHGSYHWEDPMQSGLELAQKEWLTVADAMVRLDLGTARLIVLSACETGLSDVRQSPDEFLGLPAGFLQAGAPAVVSTLWRVDDLSTMLLMERFYCTHLRDGRTPASALRAAQRWLRDATAKELDLAERWKQIYRTTAVPRLKNVAFHRMRYHSRHPQERPFDHPYHWAAFTLAGN